MDTNATSDDEEKQLEQISNEETNIMIHTSENNVEQEISVETGKQRLILRLYSNLSSFLTSIQAPHLSDTVLRRIFLLLILLIGVTGFMIALIVGSSIVQFKQQCPLFASFKFKIFTTPETNWTIKIIPLSEKFSSQSTCDFCTFYNVFTFIYCIMTGFFFILFNGDARIVTTNDQCLIVPWFPISAILGLFSLINASILTNGFLQFCSTMLSNDNRITSCTQLNHLVFEQYPNVSSFFSYMLFAIIASWLQLIFFVGIITILTIRLASSFDWHHHGNNGKNKNSINIIMQSIEQT